MLVLTPILMLALTLRVMTPMAPCIAARCMFLVFLLYDRLTLISYPHCASSHPGPMTTGPCRARKGPSNYATYFEDEEEEAEFEEDEESDFE